MVWCSGTLPSSGAHHAAIFKDVALVLSALGGCQTHFCVAVAVDVASVCTFLDAFRFLACQVEERIFAIARVDVVLCTEVTVLVRFLGTAHAYGSVHVACWGATGAGGYGHARTTILVSENVPTSL